MKEDEALVDRMADLLHRIKSNIPLWDGRTGLTPFMREDINTLLREHREAKQ